MKDIRPIILFVDDEELARRTFERMVKKDFRVLLAADVDEAQSILSEHHHEIGVLLSDQRMPGKLGVDLLEHCREMYPDIVRMLTTAYSELDDAIAAVNRGEILRYIEKPWGNIDAMLLDLNLAATIYEIKKENKQLIDEKLLAGFRNTRLEKLRTLITIASGQESTNNLLAVESLLRQIAESPAAYEPPEIEELRKAQMFGQPIGNTIAAIELSQAFLHLEKTSDPKFADLCAAGGEILNEIPETALAQIISNGLLAMKQPVKIQSSEEAEGAGILLTGEQGGSSCVRDWFGVTETSEENTSSIAALLKLYLCVYSLGGVVDLELNEAGLLKSILIKFGQPTSTPVTDLNTGSYDWIDDLMILFS